jgi:osmoprotectant transport system substrate-binding protein
VKFSLKFRDRLFNFAVAHRRNDTRMRPKAKLCSLSLNFPRHKSRTVAAALLLLLAGCSGPRAITVGSKNFTEQILLGEIVAQHLERRLGVKLDRKLDLGGTLLAHQALVSGSIDLYPEYTGTALTNVLKEAPSSDPAAVLEKVRRAYRSKWNLEWLDPLGFNNTFAIAIRGADARERHVRTLSEAAAYQPGWTLGVGYEFLRRPDGLPGLLKAYPLRLKGSPVSMDLGLLYQALDQKKVEMVAGSETDGMLSVLDVAVLEDDRHYFPPYQAALVVRESTLKADSRLRGALQELSGKLSDTEMRKLNYAVDGKHRPVREVAAEFLRR